VQRVSTAQKTTRAEQGVIPAQAGIQGQLGDWLPWTPAFAGVTKKDQD
jgi:hypothetical protein